MGNIIYKIYDDFDFTIEEKGNTFVALRKISWGEKGQPKYDLRKWYNTENGEMAHKGVTLTDEGINELTSTLLAQGFGKTDAILEAIKDRDDFERSYDKVVKGIVLEDDEDDVFYDLREVLFKDEVEE